MGELNGKDWWIAVGPLSSETGRRRMRARSSGAAGIAMSPLRIVGLLLAAGSLSGQAPPARYAAGQVWEYRTRTQDAGSLLKVQRIELLGQQKVYHISVIGVHFSTRGIAGILPHIPVSDETLDASVTKLSATKPDFPTTALDEGIEEWRKAKGGIFTIPMSQIVGIIDDQTVKGRLEAEAQPTGS